jgi:excisionase family DNA binding protein
MDRILLRPSEAAAAMGISRSRMYELLAANAVKSIRIGKSARVPVEELRAWVAAELSKQGAGTTEAA